MCEPKTSSIPGPGDVAGGLLGLAGAAMSRTGRKVLFWGFCIPLLPFALVGVFGWWTLGLVALAAAGSAACLAVMRVMHGHAVVVRPEPTHEMRAALAARGLRTIPAPGQARPALPRAMRRQLGRGRLAQPAHALPAAPIEPTAVLPASAVTRVRRTAQ